MTQPAQQPEYIITEEQLKKYEGLFFLDDDALDDFKKIRSRPHTSTPQLPQDNEKIRIACQSHNCERCTPIGKRDKRNSIRDGRFDTKEDCCKTRFGETGCPRSVEIKQAREQAQHDATIRNATLDEIVSYHKDMIARLHKPKNGAVSIVSIRSAVIQHEKSIAKLESLRTQPQEPHP